MRHGQGPGYGLYSFAGDCCQVGICLMLSCLVMMSDGWVGFRLSMCMVVGEVI